MISILYKLPGSLSYMYLPSSILSVAYGYESLEICPPQAILQQLLHGIYVLWHSLQALVQNPGTLADFTLIIYNIDMMRLYYFGTVKETHSCFNSLWHDIL